MPNRLLTTDEIAELLLSTYGIDVYEDANVPAPEIDLSICKAQDTKTLKAVGEWLENLYLPYASHDDIETFKRGEMPE